MARRKKITYEGRKRTVEFIDDKEKTSTGSGTNENENTGSENQNTGPENKNKKTSKTG
jgi:hypothetical protein